MHSVFLAFGSNLGDRRQHILGAVDRLATLGVAMQQFSSMIETAPVGFRSPNAFLNAVGLFTTALTPESLLAATEQTERLMGRTEKSRGGVYHDRIIDIDILYYDSLTLHTPSLTIPHPHISERAFVLAPLAEIAPGHIDPVSGLTAAQMLAALEAKGGALETKGRAPEVYGRSVEIKGGSVGTKRGAVGTK